VSDNGRVSDEVLVERIRSAMGRIVSHPHAVRVSAQNGRITLIGPILAHEASHLIARVQSVRGVRSINNQLEAHEGAGDLAALQGGRKRPGDVADWRQSNWSPATRLVAGAVGSGLMANCLARRSPAAILLGTVGFGLFLRGLTNLELKRLLGVRCGRRAIDVHKTINIGAPIEEVYEFWTNCESFPRFMSHLYEVRDLGSGRSRWVAAGPAGAPVTWTAVLTRIVPYEQIAWKSEAGSMIPNAGIIRFEVMGDGHTRVDIRLSYNPPAGALGHFAASLFGADPKSALDEDLVRLKSLLENGKASAPGKRATLDELLARRASSLPQSIE
jgi:uncharacterized membrane protein